MTRCTRILAFVTAAALALPAGAETPPLLDDALKKWLTGTDDWAFTQRARSFDNDKVKLERVERYDPSRPDNRRWELLEVDGKPPTPAQRDYWQQRKNKKPRRKTEKPIDQYFDFDRAAVVQETPETVRYVVPLRKEATRFVPVEKIVVEIVVNKANRAVEQVTAGMKEPFRVALGLAKVTDMGLDVRFIEDDFEAESKPAESKPTEASGTAHVVFFKFGDRAEYAWSDFKRVTPFPSRDRTVSKKDGEGL
jgi:hypothetical protein